MGWMPEATLDMDVLHTARVTQAMDRHLADFYSARARWLYNGGILSFLVGLGVLIIPQRWTPSFVLAVVVVFLVLVFELWSILPRKVRRFDAAIFPFYDDVRAKVTPTVDALDEATRSSVMRPKRETHGEQVLEPKK